MLLQRKTIGFGLIFIISIGAILSLSFKEPMAQDTRYHIFADQVSLWSIPNFWNVLSNFLFLVVGLLGVFQLIFQKNLQILKEIKIAYLLLYLGVALVALGSGYYHFSPGNESLVWDRLPMTIAFMALFSIVVGEFVSIRFAQIMLWPAVITGIASVMFWHLGEANGEGDLRFYALVQFLPMLLMPVIFIFFDSKYSGVSAYWWLLIAYLIAKLFETFDSDVFEFLGFISGHSIKHLVAATGLFILLKFYQQRQAR